MLEEYLGTCCLFLECGLWYWVDGGDGGGGISVCVWWQGT